MRVETSTDGHTIAVSDVDTTVWRVGFEPSPWSWSDWNYARDGRFDGRWDDPHGRWRTLYVADSKRACYLEVLAHFRVETTLSAHLDEIDDEDDDHPTLSPGTVPADWCTKRIVGSARLCGTYALPSAAESLSQLRSRFLDRAKALGFVDVDAAAMRQSEPRTLTQEVSAWIYTLAVGTTGVDGVEFNSRHDDQATLWAIYERPPAASSTPHLTEHTGRPVDWEDTDLEAAMRLHHLSWAAN
ncbi:RES domain-containing protein [Gordonia sihwensis]|uniref:RES domain-containing protein n=1 Tax=Gordonia sihwensis TaxID=173559 RepID=UPI0005EEE3EF|nr:RES domain-containing protein [Gordonia sihwensis]